MNSRLPTRRVDGEGARAFPVAALLTSLSSLSLLSPPLAAQDTSPTAENVLKSSGIEMHGYVDAAYSWLSEGGVFSSGATNRVFDTEPNSFNLHQAAISVSMQPSDEGWGGFVNLTAGRDARVIKSFDTSTNDFDVTQAYVRYAHGGTTFIAGKYVTLAGAEVIDPTGDATYSRSILFGYAIPFAHTGVRATFGVGEALSLIVGVNNGWDQLKDANEEKTAELGLAFIPSDAFSLFAQAYSGEEPVGIGSGTRNLIDLVANINATKRLGFTLNYDLGKQDHYTSLRDGGTIEAQWSGWAAYLKYQLSDRWGLLLRAESFDDEDGFRTGAIQEWKETTLGFAYSPTDSLALRFEVRADTSDEETFVDKDGLTVGDNQNSLGLELLYHF